jgi:peptidyl-prolyl cis-trans isomerase C
MKNMTRNCFLLSVLLMSAQIAQAGTIASVNGKVISDEDLQAVVANMSESQKSMILKEGPQRQQVIESLIGQELVYQDAQAKKIDSSKEYIKALNAFKKQAMVEILIQKQLLPKVTPQALKDYFGKNKLKYSTDQVHALHILLSTEQEANAVLAEVKKSGADFQKIAEAKSKDPSAKNNRGDLGFFTRENLDPAFVTAAFSTKVGEITGPVKSGFGYHVIKVLDRKLGKSPELPEVEQKVRMDFQRELLQNYVASLKSKAKIK